MDKKDLLSKLNGLEGNIQTQISGKADKEHTHDDLVGVAPAEHTHKKSDIIDFPESLPANGGNADTLDNKHASDFALSVHNHNISNIEGLEGEISSLKSSVSSGKNAIASAITSKGGSANGSEDFSSLANKITNLPSKIKTYPVVRINANKLKEEGNDSFYFDLEPYFPECADSNYLVVLYASFHGRNNESITTKESHLFVADNTLPVNHYAATVKPNITNYDSNKKFYFVNAQNFYIYVSESKAASSPRVNLNLKTCYIETNAVVLPLK